MGMKRITLLKTLTPNFLHCQKMQSDNDIIKNKIEKITNGKDIYPKT